MYDAKVQWILKQVQPGVTKIDLHRTLHYHMSKFAVKSPPLDPKTQKCVKKILFTVAKGGSRSLLLAAEAVPMLGPFAVMMNELIEVCDQAKCNHQAFKCLRDRLQTIAQLFADIVQTATDDSPSKIASLQICMDNLESVMKKANSEISSYTSRGFFAKFLGSKPQETFDGLDADLTKNLNELSTALQVSQYQTQKETHTVLCDLKHTIESLGGAEGLKDNNVNLQKVSRADICEIGDLSLVYWCPSFIAGCQHDRCGCE